MRESRLSGSVEGVVCNHDSYSDSRPRFDVVFSFKWNAPEGFYARLCLRDPCSRMADLGRAILTDPARSGTPQKPRSPSALGNIARSGRILDIMARKILGATALNCEGRDFNRLLLSCGGSLMDGHDVARSP